MVTNIWDSTSNREIIARCMAKGLHRHRVRQNIAYLVINMLPVQSRPVTQVNSAFHYYYHY